MAEGAIAVVVALAGVGLSVTASIFVAIRQSRLEARISALVCSQAI